MPCQGKLIETPNWLELVNSFFFFKALFRKKKEELFILIVGKLDGS